MRLSAGLAALVGAVLVAPVGAARALNLVENGDFDSGLAGWYVAPSWIEDSWSPLDAAGSPSSGSARLENLNDDGIKAGGIGQCIPVTAGVSYRVRSSIFVPSGQSADGLAGILFLWNEAEDCSGDAIGGGLGTDGAAAGFDHWYHWQSDFLPAPPGARALDLELVARKSDAAGTFVAYWDHLFVPEPAAAPLQAAALGALAALARRRRDRP